MKLPFAAAVTAVLVVAAAQSASAATQPVLAKLSAPVKGAQKPVAGGAVFECLGDVCAAREPAFDTPGVTGCKELVRQVGAVNSFGPAVKPLTADQLTSCNKEAKK